MDEILKLEPFGAGNNEPQFIIKDIKIQKTQIIKDKHILIFFQNDFSTNLKGTESLSYLFKYASAAF